VGCTSSVEEQQKIDRNILKYENELSVSCVNLVSLSPAQYRLSLSLQYLNLYAVLTLAVKSFTGGKYIKL
jgi:hypothetical protein